MSGGIYCSSDKELLANSPLAGNLAASLKPTRPPYGPHAAAAEPQGVYLLLRGGINGESEPGSVPNLSNCLCLGRHGNRYPSSSKKLIGMD